MPNAQRTAWDGSPKKVEECGHGLEVPNAKGWTDLCQADLRRTEL